MSAVVVDSSLGTLFYTHCTWPLEPVSMRKSPCETLWRPCNVHIPCTALGVSAAAIILHSPTQALARAALSGIPVRIGLVCLFFTSWLLPLLKVLEFCWPFCSPLHLSCAWRSTMSGSFSLFCKSATCRKSLIFPTRLVPIMWILIAAFSRYVAF